MICFSTPFNLLICLHAAWKKGLGLQRKCYQCILWLIMRAGGLALFFSFVFFFSLVWRWCEHVSVDLPYWDLQPYIKREHSIQPSLSVFCSLVLYHQCTVHSASFHAWNTHTDPWDVSASLCNKLVRITCLYDRCLQHLSSHSHSSCNARALRLWPHCPWPTCNTLDLMVLLLSCPWRDPYAFPTEVSLRKVSYQSICTSKCSRRARISSHLTKHSS